MGMNPHEAAAIAQVVFYAPIPPIALFLCIRNWKQGPRMAWYPPVPFSLIRLVGGIIVIVEELNPGNEGLIIASIVLLNIGLIPLVVTFLGIVRLVLESNFEKSHKIHLLVRLIRFNIIAAVVLLSTSGGFAGQAQYANVQSILSKVAYVQFLCVILTLTGMCIALRRRQERIKKSDRIYLTLMLIGCPSLFLRTAYGLLSVFEATGNNIFTSIWSSLFGSAVAFSLMALLPEYIMLYIYLYMGYIRMRSRNVTTKDEQGSHRRLSSQPQDVATGSYEMS